MGEERKMIMRKMMKSLIILGAGELGQAVAEIAKSEYNNIVFLDDSPKALKGKEFHVVGSTDLLQKLTNQYQYAICAVGNNQIRHDLRIKAKALGYIIPSIIHPSAIVNKSAHIGEGVIIRENVAISHEVVLEDGCLVNMGVLIDHCCVIGHDTHLPMGAIVRNEIHIPEMSVFVPGQVIQ